MELCKGPLPALLVQKALVVHYTMTNATLLLNTPTLKKDDSEPKHGLLEKVDEDFLL